ncbi:protein DGS1, mitochondrial-like isoform X2 [Coffea arabica]|uniref:Protein DGS1, mitochondrial isoform X2 n=1 Tax=Coffea arabica TaxID=13443 RepID=A0ABM4UY47_COFAR
MEEGGMSAVPKTKTPSPVTPLSPTMMKDVKALVSLYSNYFWNRLLSFFPNPNSNFRTKISSFYHSSTTSTTRGSSKRRRRTTCLPLPLPPASSPDSPSSLLTVEASKIRNVLEDVMECVFLNLHYIQKNLQFWQSRAEGSNAQKVYFMVCERGPNAFVNGVIQLMRDSLAEHTGMQRMSCSASSYMSERIIVLTNLRYFLAAFLAQVYTETDRVGEDLVKEPEKSVPSLLVTVNDLFLKLEASIGHFHAMRQGDSSVDGSYSFPLMFEKLPEVNQEGSQWTECETTDAINLICQNLHKLDSYLSTLLLSIRNELFETFRKRQKGVMEREEVQFTADSLHRMLLAFSEQTKGHKLPQNASDQEMLEIVMGRYEKEVMHPIQNLVGGELVRSLLIQVQKLKLDIETAMLELDQILRANEINFAILAALPAFALSLILLMLVRAWLKQDTRAEGRGRVARIQRRLLVVEIERGIMQIQTCRDQGLENDAECMFGLVLYSLDRLYCAVERHAKATGEWMCLRQDIYDLAKPGLETANKLRITSRMERVYDCLLPSPKRQ